MAPWRQNTSASARRASQPWTVSLEQTRERQGLPRRCLAAEGSTWSLATTAVATAARLSHAAVSGRLPTLAKVTQSKRLSNCTMPAAVRAAVAFVGLWLYDLLR